MTAFECRAQAEAEAGVEELRRAEKVAPVLQCSVAIKPSEPRPAWHDCAQYPPPHTFASVAKCGWQRQQQQQKRLQ